MTNNGDCEELHWTGLASDGNRIAVFREGNRFGIRYGPYWFDCGESEKAMQETVDQLVAPNGIVGEPLGGV